MVSRIVVIADQAVARGGAEAMAVLSARLFADANFLVTFFTGDDGNAPALHDAGVEVVAMGATHLLHGSKLAGMARGLYAPNSRAALSRWIAQHDDANTIYHVHSWSKFLSPSIFAALAPVQHRLILHAHDFFMVCPNGAYMNYPREEVCELVPMSAACLSTNCDKRNYAEKLWRVGRQRVREHYFDVKTSPARYLMVHRGMEPLFLRGGVRREHLNIVPNPLGFSAEDRVLAERNNVLCFIGRLDPEKGAMDAARAARAAGGQLRIIGDGVQRKQIESEYPEVEIKGWCSAQEIDLHLQSARMLVVPSRWRETFGMVIVEALRLGIPVIVSDKALIAGDLARSGAGISLDTQNAELFTETLRRLLQNDSEIKIMSEKAKHAAAELTLTPARWRDTLLAQYEQVLSR